MKVVVARAWFVPLLNAPCAQARGIPSALRLALFPFHEICRCGFLDELKALLVDVGDELAPAAIRREMEKYWDEDEGYVRTLRQLALDVGRVSFRSMLLEERNTDGDTPLVLACQWGHADVVAHLLASGVSVSTVDVSAVSMAMMLHVLLLVSARMIG